MLVSVQAVAIQVGNSCYRGSLLTAAVAGHAVLVSNGIGSWSRDDDLDGRRQDACDQEADAVATAERELVRAQADQFDRRYQENGCVEGDGEHEICCDADRDEWLTVLTLIQCPMKQRFDGQALALPEQEPEDGDQQELDCLFHLCT